jgi:hypothetical protein
LGAKCASFGECSREGRFKYRQTDSAALQGRASIRNPSSKIQGAARRREEKIKQMRGRQAGRQEGRRGAGRRLVAAVQFQAGCHSWHGQVCTAAYLLPRPHGLVTAARKAVAVQQGRPGTQNWRCDGRCCAVGWRFTKGRAAGTRAPGAAVVGFSPEAAFRVESGQGPVTGAGAASQHPVG